MSSANSPALLRIASRGSALAQTQARLVRAALGHAHDWPEPEWEALCPIIAVKTTGDRITDRPLADAGGKGLFVKEVEDAVLQGAADIAVHSLKDLPAVQPAGLAISAVLPREDPRDVLIARDAKVDALARLPRGAKLGTSSIRRQAQALKARPDLSVVSLRGNVESRLSKLARGDADAVLLARSGLARLSLTPQGAVMLAPDIWLPAPCQGVIGIELRAADAHTRALVTAIDDAATALSVAAERAFLEALDGSCRTPIAALAQPTDAEVHLRGQVLTPDGVHAWSVERRFAAAGGRSAAREAGRDAALEIRAQAGVLLPRG